MMFTCRAALGGPAGARPLVRYGSAAIAYAGYAMLKGAADPWGAPLAPTTDAAEAPASSASLTAGRRQRGATADGKPVMAAALHSGDCVKLPDGRIGRVRDGSADGYRVRVRRKTSKSHQFLAFTRDELERVECPKGWMSREGYNRYLKATLAKMRERAPRSESGD